MKNDGTRIVRLTVDLCYPGAKVPTRRLEFFGATRDEAEEMMLEACETDDVLRALMVDLEPEYEGMIQRHTFKSVSLDRVRKPELGYD